MPKSAPRPCTYPGCSALVHGGSRCEKHRHQPAPRSIEPRQNSNARGYGYKWQQARAGFLKSHPLCADHLKRGQVVAASVVDHITPHRGDQNLFWDKSNWQPLCQSCHNAKTAREDGGFGNTRGGEISTPSTI